MKHTNTSGLFLALAGLVALAVAFVAWWGISEMFVNLMGANTELRADLIAIVVVSALFAYILARLQADDERTATLSTILAVGSGGLVLLMFIATSLYKANGGDLSKVDETLRWAVPATWALPVLIGDTFFILRSLDRYWGTTKKSIVSGTTSKYVRIVYNGLHTFGMGAALVASAIGTYAVMHRITGDWFVSLSYLLTVEAAIFLFADWNNRTQDKSIFWVTFAVSQLGFFAATLFQLGNADQTIYGGNEAAMGVVGRYAKEFWLVPPFVVGAIFTAVYVLNQTKKPELFPSKSEREPGRGDAPWQIERPRHEAHRPQFQRPDRGAAMMERGGDESRGETQFAEPGGLDRDVVAGLKELGYPGGRIARMRKPEAEGRLRGHVRYDPSKDKSTQPYVKRVPVSENNHEQGERNP